MVAEQIGRPLENDLNALLQDLNPLKSSDSYSSGIIYNSVIDGGNGDVGIGESEQGIYIYIYVCMYVLL